MDKINSRTNVETDKINIRRAKKNEAELLSQIALISKAHWPYPKDYLDKCKEALHISEKYIEEWPVYLAEYESKVVGFFALKIIKDEPRLDNLWVLPEFIGHGIGKRLFKRAVAEARRLGWSSFRLAADPYAIGFYEKMGAVQIGTVQSRIKPDLFLPHMEFQILPIEITFRTFNSGDDVKKINSLLLSAYRPLAEKGMKFAASHEDVMATKRNIEDGECHIGIYENEIVTCAILRIPSLVEKTGWKAKGPRWYQVEGVTTFGRFAVLPELQGEGIGAKMMDVMENRARELGFLELALDTSEHADHLIKMYEARGYRFIEHHQWEITNYRSVVMSKKLVC
ncbi:MAG: GNAT family N-acetyltransferase [Bacteriovorax sp.]